MPLLDAPYTPANLPHAFPGDETMSTKFKLLPLLLALILPAQAQAHCWHWRGLYQYCASEPRVCPRTWHMSRGSTLANTGASRLISRYMAERERHAIPRNQAAIEGRAHER